MSTNTTFLLSAASLLACVGLAATAGAADEVPVLKNPEPPLYRPFTLGLEGGTTGFGGSFSWRFADHFGARVGADYLSLSDTGIEAGGIHYNSTLRLLSEPLTFDIYPWRKSSFHVSAGVMFNQQRLTGTANQNGTIIIGGVPTPISTIGTLSGKIEQHLVNPYLSIGGNLFYFDRAHRWAMWGELGVAYTGEPTTSLTRSGPPNVPADVAVAIAHRELQAYADQYKWWPVAKIGVTYSF